MKRPGTNSPPNEPVWKANPRKKPSTASCTISRNAVTEFRANGWQIGSGPTQAQCGTTTDRIQGKGRRWDPDNALALMALEALYQSHAWDPHWNLN